MTRGFFSTMRLTIDGLVPTGVRLATWRSLLSGQVLSVEKGRVVRGDQPLPKRHDADLCKDAERLPAGNQRGRADRLLAGNATVLRRRQPTCSLVSELYKNLYYVN